MLPSERFGLIIEHTLGRVDFGCGNESLLGVKCNTPTPSPEEQTQVYFDRGESMLKF